MPNDIRQHMCERLIDQIAADIASALHGMTRKEKHYILDALEDAVANQNYDLNKEKA